MKAVRVAGAATFWINCGQDFGMAATLNQYHTVPVPVPTGTGTFLKFL
jgi:hypothetical protein